MMEILSVEGNTQRLDGGSMYGNCPRVVWEKWSPPDDLHRISLACRAFLVRTEGRNILLEAGIGAFFDPKQRSRYGVVEGEHRLLQSLAVHGVTPEQVDIVILSHVHFDHAGGLLGTWEQDKEPVVVFPNAAFVVGRRAWERAKSPHVRDRVSFVPAIVRALEASGRLILVDDKTDVVPSTFSFRFSDGHTPGMMLTRVETPQGPATFAGDLVPGTPWVHLPITMGYDRFPELLIDEKRVMLNQVVEERGWLLYTHDSRFAASHIALDEKGKYVPVDVLPSVRWTHRSA